MITTFELFVPIAEDQKDSDFAYELKRRVESLADSVNRHAWDGKWYVRAFTDEGVPLGTSRSKEFKIDAIAQAWSVLSEKGEYAKVSSALESVKDKLIGNNGLLQLITPPVSKIATDPGYIKDYPPGIRENGSQYNHAALWAAQAFAKFGDGNMAKKIIDMVNPINRSLTEKDARHYRVEPYVVASDIYAGAYKGRGGWTWYTGSAGVMYRTILEYMLGFTKRGKTLSFVPCMPTEWPTCTIVYKYGRSTYTITLVQKEHPRIGQPCEITLDGVPQGTVIELVDDGTSHGVTATRV
jgi:cyclic beta-1,2-glucan synthetase